MFYSQVHCHLYTTNVRNLKINYGYKIIKIFNLNKWKIMSKFNPDNPAHSNEILLNFYKLKKIYYYTNILVGPYSHPTFGIIICIKKLKH